MSEQTGGCVVNTPEGEAVALLVLPMNLDAYLDVLQALSRHFPDARVRRLGDARFDDVEILDELRANPREPT
ncbi:MAG: hypothetical protein OXQ93_12395 [Gemmatimonadota bacterium]|nr:hypothetical protein [Gemmatimonadota bacterium]